MPFDNLETTGTGPEDPPLQPVSDERESRSRQVRILIVEDEFFVAMLLEEDLREAGFSTVGPFTSLARAVEACRRETFDLAVLDINLKGEMVYPLADDLSGRDVPFIFLSGYTSLDLPERFRTFPRLSKPYHRPELIREIRRVLRPGR